MGLHGGFLLIFQSMASEGRHLPDLKREAVCWAQPGYMGTHMEECLGIRNLTGNELEARLGYHGRCVYSLEM